ncbi:MAG: adenylate/guanylate cyclase domain-containing protein [Jaaginema sp. PMC 1079.18]|nr:adenylate/guanylate cyclase domain-containing protein [Jaaginema sp. PMC 1080.18]MEC4851702.1 adenylate/guanylate cyclase domain-containing protein [Jaaginema sp. PMC 1079.18]MEC4865049.1 adenylate/guanylate cyclase domain-containing protein [Jaaginema sp. PMC 1078.18]
MPKRLGLRKIFHSWRSDKDSHNGTRVTSLRTVVVVLLVAHVGLTAALIGYLAFRNGQKAVNDLASQLRRELTARIEQELTRYLDTPHDINRVSASALLSGDLRIDDAASAGLFLQQMKVSPFLNSVYCGSDRDGNFLGVTRADDNPKKLLIMARNAVTDGFMYFYELDNRGEKLFFVEKVRKYDPRVRPWYKAAANASRPIWSPVYLDFTSGLPTVTASLPVYDRTGNELIGACGADVLLSAEFRDFLQNLEIGDNGEAFIIESSGKLISSTSDNDLVIGEGDDARQRLASESSDPLIQDTTEFLRDRFGDFRAIDGTQQLEFKINGARQFVQVYPMRDGRGLDWLIVLTIPEADFMQQVHRQTRASFLLSMLVAFLAVTIGILAARWLSGSIVQLSGAAQTIAAGNFSSNAEPISQQFLQIREFSSLSTSFKSMAGQLQRSFQDLERVNERLEQQVQERTASLVTAEAELRGLFEAMTELIILFDGGGYYRKIISSNLEFLKVPVDQLLNRRLHDIFERSQADSFLSHIQQALTTQKTVSVEYSLVLQGKETWFAANVTPTANNMVLWVARDISDRVAAQQETQLLLNLAQAISSAVDFDSALEVALRLVCQTTQWAYGEAWVATTDETALECSPLWYCDPDEKDNLAEFRNYSEALTFLSHEGIPGQVWATQQTQWVEDISQWDDVFMRLELANTGGLKSGFGVPIQRPPNGSNTSVQTPQNEVLAVLVFFTREAREQDAKLRDLVSAVAAQLGTVLQQKKVQAEMKALFAAMTDMLTVRDVSGRCLHAIPTQAQFPLIPLDVAVGRTLPDDLPPNTASIVLQGIQTAVSQQIPVRLEYSVPLSDGELWIAETVSPLSDETAILVSRDISDRKLVEAALRLEQEKSEKLLLNILPEAIVRQLKQAPGTLATQFDEVTILFADIVGFTSLSERLEPIELVNLLNRIFSQFDLLAEQYNLEKIKTIGDAYMVVGGLPVPREDHAEAIAEIALEMQAAIAQLQQEIDEPIKIRIGINTGPVVAGVIGIKKFIYDLWGDAVNLASRMESQGEPSKIQLTEATYQRLRHSYVCEKRGAIAIKGKGEAIAYWLKGRI